MLTHIYLLGIIYMGDIMNYLLVMLKKEEKRNNNMMSEYLRELDSLPRGSIKEKTVNGNKYYYLNYRDGDKVVSKYVGKDNDLIIELKEQLKRRKQIEELLKMLIKERSDIQKMEAII